MKCTLFQMSVFFFNLERKKTQKTKDVYIYDCYNFNWYILLNVKHIDRIPKWHTHSRTHKHEILGKLFVPCWPVYQSDEQMSPFTSNFTSDVTKNKERKKGEMFGVNEHMVHAVFKRVQASETTSVVL